MKIDKLSYHYPSGKQKGEILLKDTDPIVQELVKKINDFVLTHELAVLQQRTVAQDFTAHAAWGRTSEARDLAFPIVLDIYPLKTSVFKTIFTVGLSRKTLARKKPIASYSFLLDIRKELFQKKVVFLHEAEGAERFSELNEEIRKLGVNLFIRKVR